MRRLLKKILFRINLIFLVFSVFSVWGQEAEDWIRPNSETVREEIRYAQALTPELPAKLSVITQIMNSARSGGVSPEDKSVMRVLRYLAEEGTRTLKVNRFSAGADFPEARRASCEALGYIGGESSRKILVDVLKVENEPMVLSEAVFSLGKITSEPDEELIRIFTALLEKRVLVSGGDNNLALALLGAIDRLADSKSGVRDENLFRTLLRIPDAPLLQSVRYKAMLLIEKMKGF